MRIAIALVVGLLSLGCDYRIMLPAAPSNNITNSNTNTNTVDIDAHDVINLNPTFPPTTDNPNVPPTSSVPLPIPFASEGVARTAAHANRGLLSSSCSNTQFLNAIVNALRTTDARWGYVSKGGCSTTSRDSIAYRATNTDTGIWIVDVIGDHCGTAPTFTWNIVGYAADMAWCSR